MNDARNTMRTCSSCGWTNVGAMTVCLHCAAPLGAPTTATATAFCGTCGNRVNAGDRFCTTCGAPVTA
jgi:uncharacterized membrane protein YvbJ